MNLRGFRESNHPNIAALPPQPSRRNLPVGSSRQVDFCNHVTRKTKIRQANRAGIKRIGFNNIGTRSQVFSVDIHNRMRVGQTDNIRAVFQIDGPIRKSISPYIRLFQFKRVNHGTHSAIQHQYFMGQTIQQTLLGMGSGNN